jgi:hypothetical protein
VRAITVDTVGPSYREVRRMRPPGLLLLPSQAVLPPSRAVLPPSRAVLPRSHTNSIKNHVTAAADLKPAELRVENDLELRVCVVRVRDEFLNTFAKGLKMPDSSRMMLGSTLLSLMDARTLSREIEILVKRWHLPREADHHPRAKFPEKQVGR